MANNRRLIAVDCETDPAKYGDILTPFLWGVYDGSKFFYFDSTEKFVTWIKSQNVIAYAHNGGKFDFMFLVQYVGQTKAQVINGRIVKMKLGKAEMRDSYAAIPEALSKFGQKKEILYSKMKVGIRDKYMAEIIEYLEMDCVSLYNVMQNYREIAGTKTTIASNALTFAKKIGVDFGKTNHTYDTKLRKYYFGGRCQLFRPGTHKNIRIIDIHSAYPYAMCSEHPVGSQFLHIPEKQFRKLNKGQQQRAFIHLRCFSDMAFPFREKMGLEFPCDYSEYYVTGWEYIAAKELGLISDEKILDIIVLEDHMNFIPYVEHWYNYKDQHSAKDKDTGARIFPIQYEIGKRMMNSLYGKATQNPAKYFDYIIKPAGSKICYEYDAEDQSALCAHCKEKAIDHGWEICTEFGNIEVHRRSALWRYQFKFGKNWEGQPLYNNVATGASITGFTRAHLLRAIHTVGFERVIYCDTDSIILDSDVALSGLALSNKLGDWADEGTGSVGHFAGKKLYGIKLDEMCNKFSLNQDTNRCKNCEMPEGKHGGHPQIKIASKGAKLHFTDIERIINGEKITWENPFPHFSLAGEQKSMLRNIRSTASRPNHMET